MSDIIDTSKVQKIVEKPSKPAPKEVPLHVPAADLSDLKITAPQKKAEPKNTKIIRAFQETKTKIDIDDDLFGEVNDKPKGKDTKIGDIDIDAYIAQNSNASKGGLFD